MNASRMVVLSNCAACPASTDQFKPAKRLRPSTCAAGIVSQHGAEQRHRQADAADDGVLPGRFERGGLP